MSEAFTEQAGTGDLMVVVDHASAHVPPDIALGVPDAVVARHIGWDIGAAALGEAFCARLGSPGLFGGVSRLVIDLHREPDSRALIPETSDGQAIPGNQGLSAAARAARIDRFWTPYHARLEALVDQHRPQLILAVHSFTPRLETGPDRPWEIGILYNQDDRAARLAITALGGAGIVTGDNEPYSGKQLNYTMNRHAEARGLPYLAIEVRNDLIATPGGVARWAATLAPIVQRCHAKVTA